MTNAEFTFGEEVAITWGVSEVRGRVVEVYGAPTRRHVVVELSPELSDFIVAEPTTVSLPVDEVKKVTSAA